jgi:hypothetical protein
METSLSTITQIKNELDALLEREWKIETNNKAYAEGFFQGIQNALAAVESISELIVIPKKELN